MNPKYLNLFLVILTGFLLRPAQASDIDNAPKIRLYYAQTFDGVCSKKLNYDINSSWRNELIHRIHAWQNLWDSEGHLLLKTSIKLVKKTYPEPIYKTAISLCSFPSMSAPLIVNGRYALNSFINKPINDDVFISTIFHEVLHNYIDAFLPQNTPLLDKYKSESKGVLDHLHLLALEKGVYLKLGWNSKLNAVIAKDESLPNGDYKRAWEIVNSDQNYLEFISELKSMPDKMEQPLSE